MNIFVQLIEYVKNTTDGKWLGTIFGLSSTIIAGLYIIMRNHVRDLLLIHSKNEEYMNKKIVDLTAENSRCISELENLKKDSRKYADDVISTQKDFFSKQTTELRSEIENLKNKIIERDKKISELDQSDPKNKDKIIFNEETKEKLQRTIAAYEEIINKLVLKEGVAEQIIQILKSGILSTDNLEKQIKEELQERINAINRTSYNRSYAMRSAVFNEAVTKRAQEANKKLAEYEKRNQIEQKALLKFSKKIDLPRD